MQTGIDHIGIITPFFCYNEKGQFLFYKRGSKSKDEQGKWDCSGGTMQFGDQPDETMKRKLSSQYSTEPLKYEQLPAVSIILEKDNIKEHWLAIPFIVQIKSELVKIGEPEKMDEIGWFTLDNLPNPLHPGAEYLLKFFNDRFKKATL